MATWVTKAPLVSLCRPWRCPGPLYSLPELRWCVPSKHHGVHGADRPGETLWHGRVCLRCPHVSDILMIVLTLHMLTGFEGKKLLWKTRIRQFDIVTGETRKQGRPRKMLGSHFDCLTGGYEELDMWRDVVCLRASRMPQRKHGEGKWSRWFDITIRHSFKQWINPMYQNILISQWSKSKSKTLKMMACAGQSAPTQGLGRMLHHRSENHSTWVKPKYTSDVCQMITAI